MNYNEYYNLTVQFLNIFSLNVQRNFTIAKYSTFTKEKRKNIAKKRKMPGEIHYNLNEIVNYTKFENLAKHVRTREYLLSSSVRTFQVYNLPQHKNLLLSFTVPRNRPSHTECSSSTPELTYPVKFRA